MFILFYAFLLICMLILHSQKAFYLCERRDKFQCILPISDYVKLACRSMPKPTFLHPLHIVETLNLMLPV